MEELILVNKMIDEMKLYRILLEGRLNRDDCLFKMELFIRFIMLGFRLLIGGVF
jgi:hypothetical protein